MEDGLTEDYLFCKHVTGKTNAGVSTQIMKWVLKVWARHLKNNKTGTMNVRVSQLFVALHERDDRFTEEDFKTKGGSLPSLSMIITQSMKLILPSEPR